MKTSRLAIRGIVAAALILLAVLWFLRGKRKYFDDPTLVATKSRDRSTLYAQMKGGPAFLQPLWKVYYRLWPPASGTWSFPAETNRCSIQGILIQCQDVSGIQFFIDKNVAAGSVLFGPTNVLNGPQWVSAFTSTLQTGHPEWWDKAKGGFRRENLALIPAGRKAFLVLPKERVSEYQKER